MYLYSVVKVGERYIQVWALTMAVCFPITIQDGETLWAINWRWGRRSLVGHYTLTTVCIISQRVSTIPNLVSWFPGKSLKFLPPDVIF